MEELTTLGEVPWSRDDIRASLDEFEGLYAGRPIRDNQGGMKAPHMFAVWFMARALSPKLVIESGVWRGQGTWLLEKACPAARIVSIDLDLSLRKYVSGRVEYSDKDFSEHDWSDVDPNETLVFFDDHQNAYTRLQQCRWFGFRHMIFEDNYPPAQGDCYSLKKAFAGVGFNPEPTCPERANRGVFVRLRRTVAALCGTGGSRMTPDCRRSIPANEQDARFLRRQLEAYYEFPPVFQPGKTRWGDSWDQTNYATPPPLLETDMSSAHRVFWDEAIYYTWICYARLKHGGNSAVDGDGGGQAERIVYRA